MVKKANSVHIQLKERPECLTDEDITRYYWVEENTFSIENKPFRYEFLAGGIIIIENYKTGIIKQFFPNSNILSIWLDLENINKRKIISIKEEDVLTSIFNCPNCKKTIGIRINKQDGEILSLDELI